MAKLTVETIPPIPVEPQKRFVLELSRDEMNTLFALTGKVVPTTREGKHLAAIYNALSVECRGTVKGREYIIKMCKNGNGYFFDHRPESKS